METILQRIRCFLIPRRLAGLIVVAVSLATHLAFFGHPNEVVFDEVHIGKYVGAYGVGRYYFDVHPPLGRLLIAGAAEAGGVKMQNQFANIGESYPDSGYILLRLLPLISGILLPFIVYILALEWKFSTPGAVLAGLLAALDNALVVQSRFMLTDIIMLAFGFAALLFYSRHKRTGAWRDMALAGILSGAAVSIKWTGAAFIALPFIFEAVNLRRWWRDRRRWLKNAVGFVILPALVYIFASVSHLVLLPESGPGDAFMSKEFQRTLIGNQYAGDSAVESKNLAQKFFELQKEMYKVNRGFTTVHQYGSKWYTWPVMYRPIYYWSKNNAAHIYLIGNPVIWWGSALAMVGVIGGLIWTAGKKRRRLALIASGFILNWLPFAFIGRVMFLYHYLASLVFAALGLAFLLDVMQSWRTPVMTVVIALVLSGFLFFAPLTYGLPLPADALAYRMWFPLWR